MGAPLSPSELKAAIKGADAIIPVIPDQITADIISGAPNLKVIATYSVGYDNIDIEAATKKCIYVANTPGDLTESVAEHCMSVMLALGRRIVEADKFCREGKYEYWDPLAFIGPKFYGKTLGIIGFGRIGQSFAKMARHGFGMNILYSDVTDHKEAEALLDAKKVDLNTLLETSDVVSLNCNLCAETKHMIGEPQLRRMKPLAILINSARGPIINEKALAVALKAGWISGAALDVFENEPEINKTLLKLPNVVLTPHIASATWEARIQMARMAAENVVDVLVSGKPPRYLVNRDVVEKCVMGLV